MEPQKPASQDDTQLTPELPSAPQSVAYTEPEGSAPQQQQPLSQPPATEPQQNQNPGKGLAIAGIVLAFFPLQLIGFILSIIALVKSRSGTSTRLMGIIGIVLNIIGSIVTALLISIIIAAYAGVAIKAQDEQSKAAAVTIESTVESYAKTNNMLPTSKAELKDSTSQDITLEEITSKPLSANTVEYALCGETTARIGRWDYVNKKVVYSYIGNRDTDESSLNCTIVTN